MASQWKAWPILFPFGRLHFYCGLLLACDARLPFLSHGTLRAIGWRISPFPPFPQVPTRICGEVSLQLSTEFLLSVKQKCCAFWILRWFRASAIFFYGAIICKIKYYENENKCSWYLTAQKMMQTASISNHFGWQTGSATCICVGSPRETFVVICPLYMYIVRVF